MQRNAKATSKDEAAGRAEGIRYMLRQVREKRTAKNRSKDRDLKHPINCRSLDDIRQHSTDASLANNSVDGGYAVKSVAKPREKLPFVLFTTFSDDKVPGPGEYNVTVGTIQDRMKRGYGASFKGRNGSIDFTEPTPGPAAYDIINAKQRTLNNTFSIGRAKRDINLNGKETIKPGPLDYDALKPNRIKGTVIFNSIQPPKLGNSNPGPGTYRVNPTLPRAPKFAFATERRFMSSSVESIKDSAGPANYRPSYNFTKVSQPRAIFGTSSRKDTNERSSSPGVGQYRPEIYQPKNLGGSVFNTEKRFMRNLRVVLK